ncbi:hypothetical protein NP493_1364g00028 [Ridgeia piscesae]|uniref:RNA polymerase II-associated protein 3 n=1 Tax=Ridgeia piscesae TaxID=27915 RepID=A0AAD9NFN7_RIDPI|nr:hypothetical protein NP493_1364g00028 [Ridgeia piscesae]
MDPQRMAELQLQMRVNQSELEQYVHELNNWEDDIKQKEVQLKKCDRSQGDVAKETSLPPIRNSLEKKKKRKKKKQVSSNGDTSEVKTNEAQKPRRIRSSDYKSWDKFDVEKACLEIDDGETKSSSSEYETDEEWEAERKIKQAEFLKDQGNQYFKDGKYDEAIECYTQGIECDPTNALLPANRAMALLKQDKFAAAELDCTQAIALDSGYTKAYFRRATARERLSKLMEAKQDISTILSIDPANKQAAKEMAKIEKLLNPPKEPVGIVGPVDKSPSQRSKKPLRRMQIEEIGLDKEEEVKRLHRKNVETVLAKQSEVKKQVTARDEATFDAFVKQKKDTPCNSVGSGSVHSSVTPKETALENIDDIRQNGSESPRELGQEAGVLNLKAKSSSEHCTDKEPSPRTSPRLPPVPTSSFQFQTDWKALRNSPEMCFQYFKNIECRHYPKLFGQALDADILPRILSILEEFYIPNNLDMYAVLESLTRVKRFSMTLMFMSAKEKQCLQQIFKHLRTAGLQSESDIASLAKTYQV